MLQLTPELLEDTIGLVHPDRHPTRTERANRVTAALLALRPFVKPADVPIAGTVEVTLRVLRVTLSATGLVCDKPAYLLSYTVLSRVEGATLTLFDFKPRHEGVQPINPSSGTMTPNIETRFPGIHHRTAIYAVIRGEMTVSFDYL